VWFFSPSPQCSLKFDFEPREKEINENQNIFHDESIATLPSRRTGEKSNEKFLHESDRELMAKFLSGRNSIFVSPSNVSIVTIEWTGKMKSAASMFVVSIVTETNVEEDILLRIRSDGILSGWSEMHFRSTKWTEEEN
jgi:hypothetical protein